MQLTNFISMVTTASPTDDNTVAVVAKVNGNPNTDILSANPTCVPATTLTITKSEPTIVVQQVIESC